MLEVIVELEGEEEVIVFVPHLRFKCDRTVDYDDQRRNDYDNDFTGHRSYSPVTYSVHNGGINRTNRRTHLLSTGPPIQ